MQRCVARVMLASVAPAIFGVVRCQPQPGNRVSGSLFSRFQNPDPRCLSISRALFCQPTAARHMSSFTYRSTHAFPQDFDFG
ncbi:hypothetical protein FN846DRAFT_224574 [Sphaerosporella brunnea]|uniref:Secreted protein n=1 Tax=Sphaerosporella brunnea TaxID=1250544 RepID=A0A5J5EP09_9PEZI|nr:hypothetical protein FN846DRAFT_224574 [Sphaerosporella brunnea]